jgi:hypothetical protein
MRCGGEVARGLAGCGAGAAEGTCDHKTREGGVSDRACVATYFAPKYHNEQLGEGRGRTASAPAPSAGTAAAAMTSGDGGVSDVVRLPQTT